MALFRDTGERAVFDELYRRSAPSLASWILFLLASRGLRVDPGEVLQDTFVNVYRYAASYRDSGESSFRGWARAIAANLVRRRSRHVGWASLDAEATGEPADAARGPAESVLAQEESLEMRGAYALLLLGYAQAHQRLSTRDRRALELIELRGASYASAGRELRVGRSNMKMIMFRARKRLREQMLGLLLVPPAERGCRPEPRRVR